MAQQQQTGTAGQDQGRDRGHLLGEQPSGETADPTYNLVSVLYHALQAADTCITYAKDAGGDQELSEFFKATREGNLEISRQAKELLARRLRP